MAGDVRQQERQQKNHTQQILCGGPPVSGSALIPPAADITKTQGIIIKKQCADVSKLASPTQSPPPGSANASATPDAPVMSHSSSMSHHTLSATPSERMPPSHSVSHTSTTTETPTPPVSESAPGASNGTSPETPPNGSTPENPPKDSPPNAAPKKPAPENPPKDSPPDAAPEQPAPESAPPPDSNNHSPDSSNGTSPDHPPPNDTSPNAPPPPDAPPPNPPGGSSSSSAKDADKPAAASPTDQPPAAADSAQPTPPPNLQLPGLAAANPTTTTTTDPIDLEAAPSSTASPSKSQPSEAAADPPPPEEDSGASDDSSSTPPVVAAPSPTEKDSGPTQLPPEILPSDPADASSASMPSTLMTDLPTPSSLVGSGTTKGPGSSPSSDIVPAPAPTSTGGGPPQLQADNGGSSGPPMGMIIGSAVGGAAAIAIIALLLWLWRRRVRRKREEMAGWPTSPFADHRVGHDQQPVNNNNSSSGSSNDTTAVGMAVAGATAGPFAAGRQASTRSRNPLQGWWSGRAPLIASDHGEQMQQRRQQLPAMMMNLRGGGGSEDSNDPFSDAHSTEAVRTAPVLSQQQQMLRGILKPSSSNSGGATRTHGRYPSDGSVTSARRSRAQSFGSRGWWFASSSQQQPPPPMPQPRPVMSRRTSSLTNDPFDDRRNKFRSDPFDLELDTRLLPSSLIVSQPQRSGNGRASSVYSDGSGGSGGSSSRYTSGVSSSSVWGPTGGPAADGRAYVSDSPTLPLATRAYGGGGGVGQAM